MKTLMCDIHLGGSTQQYLETSKEELTKQEFVNALSERLIHNARTRPITLARRVGALIGLVYDQMNGEDYYLDVIIEAVSLADKKIKEGIK